MTDCPYCEETHGDLLLCAPAKRFLDAVIARGRRFDLPAMEFDEPVGGAGMFGPDTVLMAQFLAKAAVVPVAGMHKPVLIITGADADGRPLPNWLYAGNAAEIRRAVKITADMGEMAIRRARDLNRTQPGR
jgi:hypothetical protein